MGNGHARPACDDPSATATPGALPLSGRKRTGVRGLLAAMAESAVAG
ncbi:hypothetical protein P3T39_002314 [Kitasatospora sp. GP82]|nr:hypothetical protein [Kitasatospora sp. GP82]